MCLNKLTYLVESDSVVKELPNHYQELIARTQIYREKQISWYSFSSDTFQRDINKTSKWTMTLSVKIFVTQDELKRESQRVPAVAKTVTKGKNTAAIQENRGECQLYDSFRMAAG